MIYLAHIDTPLGTMLAGAVEDGIILLEFEDGGRGGGIHGLRRRVGGDAGEGDSPWFPRLREELDGYFSGAVREFSLPLVTMGTPFQESVWRSLLEIPYGATLSYGEQADRLGRPGAVRAVAAANARNRIAILIPCHRVIGADGGLTGYGGGLWRKRRLLELEGKDAGRIGG